MAAYAPQANMWGGANPAGGGAGGGPAVPPPALPYIGAKISLISSAGIRYEGSLANVDPEKSTLGLHNVRTYGTEGRDVEHKIPPSDDIYDYIVFRGKDILDLTVSEPFPAPLDDPAIVMCAPMSRQQAASGGTGMHGHAMPYGPMGVAPQANSMGLLHPNQQGYASGAAASMISAFGGGHQPGGGPTVGGNHQLARSQLIGSVGQQQQQQAANNNNNLLRMAFPSPTPPNQYGNAMRYDHQYLGAPRRGGLGGLGGRGVGGGLRGLGGYGIGPKRVTGELTPRVNELLKTQLEPTFNFEEWNRKFEKYPVPKPGAATQQQPSAALKAATGAPGAATGSPGSSPPTEKTVATTTDGSADQKTGDEHVAGATAASRTADTQVPSGSSTQAKAATPGSAAPLPTVNPVYDKGRSFFDNISCEALDRQAGYQVRVDRTRQKELDVETFGPSAANSIRRGGRGYRRGGGGYPRTNMGPMYNRLPGGSLMPMSLHQQGIPAAMMHPANYPSYPC